MKRMIRNVNMLLDVTPHPLVCIGLCQRLAFATRDLRHLDMVAPSTDCYLLPIDLGVFGERLVMRKLGAIIRIHALDLAVCLDFRHRWMTSKLVGLDASTFISLNRVISKLGRKSLRRASSFVCDFDRTNMSLKGDGSIIALAYDADVC